MKNIFVNPLKMFFPKKIIGIDVGAASIKIVEISRWGKGNTLENYGEVKSSLVYKKVSSVGGKSANLFSADIVSSTVKEILSEAKIKTKEAVFSVPDFSIFCTSFEMPRMPEKEVPGAIKYNASQYITLPISEVALDWQIISPPSDDKKRPIKVFLTAMPNQIVQEYQDIAKRSGLELYALEADALAIARSLAKNSKKIICMADIGVQSSTVNIVDNGLLKRSYSFNFHGSQLTKAISSAIGIKYEEAEDIKSREGILSSRPDVVETLYLLINPLLAEIRSISGEFLQSEQKQIEEIYLTGGSANLPGLKEYFEESLKKKVFIPNCFSGFLYPPILEETLKEMSPRFSVAVGAALGGLEI